MSTSCLVDVITSTGVEWSPAALAREDADRIARTQPRAGSHPTMVRRRWMLALVSHVAKTAAANVVDTNSTVLANVFELRSAAGASGDGRRSRKTAADRR
ncbi:MAG: hypothetical protein ABSB70_06725 [Candidatus Velthaea sp.]|jgi:hypothetical protein